MEFWAYPQRNSLTMDITIEPTEFDVVVVGTGLQESIIAG